MWKAGVDTKMNIGGADDDDWETDPDFVVSAIIQVLCVHFLCWFRISVVDVLDLTLRYRFNHDFHPFPLEPDIYSLRRLSL